MRSKNFTTRAGGWKLSRAFTTVFVAAFASLACAALGPVPSHSQPRVEELRPEALRQQIEEDWLSQAQAMQGFGVSLNETDAIGGCDGQKDGKYGFHTAQEPNPWWQVDLGQAQDIGRIVVFNRLDYAPGLHNADRLQILTSTDGAKWTLRHDNAGVHFGGVSGPPPLEVSFKDAPVNARYVRLQIPSKTPVYLHLDEVEVYSAPDPLKNLALHRPASQSSTCQWSVAKTLPISVPIFPTQEWVERGRKLLSDLEASGASLQPLTLKLENAAQRLKALPADASEAARRDLYLETRWIVRAIVFANPLLDFNQLLFVKRFTQESYPDVCLNHMPWVSRPGGDICVLSAPTGQKLFSSLGTPSSSRPQLRYLLNRALGPGHVHGMDLWWDGSRVVFGYARAAADEPPEGWLNRATSYQLRRSVEPIHIFEMGVDGTGLRQLTSGEWSDLDPTYAPSGDIVFVSERCGTSLQCNEYDKDETSCNLYTMRPDGSGIRRLSANKDGDYLPHTLDDGTIGYVRWEYHERSWAFIQSIWNIHPDGTFADAVFKQHFVNPWSLEDTRSIPASKKLVSIASGHHTLAMGPLVVVDPSVGISNPKGISIVTPQVVPPEGGMDGVPVKEGGTRDGSGFYSTPWPLSEKYFLASYSYSKKEIDAAGYALYLVDVFGNKELVFRDPAISCFIPMPLRPRTRPPILPELVNLATNRATCVISDAGFGSEEVAGRVRFVRVAEPIGWPYDNELGGQRYGEKGRNLINWTPIRILGDVPVESDGSAHFEVPADTAVYFQLLDENRMELRRMRSFISFQPGEQRACAGCHETRGLVPQARSTPLAASLPPRPYIKPPWGDRPVSFLRDIQPILDRHCVECHTGLKPAGGLDFSPGLTDWSGGKVAGYGFNRAFETIYRRQLVAAAEPNLQDASITPPLAYGAHKSKLLEAIDSEAHRKRAQLTANERLSLTMWMDANAPYHDKFVNKRAAQKAYDISADKDLAARIGEVHQRRCATCHKPGEVSRPDWIDLSNPDHTLFLRAPLIKTAGGAERCAGKVYKDKSDADYQAVLDLLQHATQKAWAAPRRDLQAFTNPSPGSSSIR